MPRYRSLIALLLSISLPLIVSGCGSSSEVGEQGEAAPPRTEQMAPAPTDSLAMANQQLRDQVNALSSENRALTSRVSFLESQLAAARAMAAGQTGGAKAEPTPAATGMPTPDNPNSPDTRAAYESALATAKRHEYGAAIEKFQDLLTRGIRADLADNCHYWLGECYYAERKYDLASQEFQSVIDVKTSDKTTDAMLMLGNSYAAEGKSAEAKKVWNDLVNTWPTSPAAIHAKARLGIK